MPTSDAGKAIASRNATTHGLFARDVVLPLLGEDPAGYQQLQDEWTKQLTPRNLLEQHYVEKIAAASWRLRRLHRWQAQLFEDETLTEDERLDRLNSVLRHETALHRQIDTAVKMLHKDAPQLYARRLRDQVLQDLHITERECRDEPETDLGVSLEVSNRLYQLRKSTTQAANELSEAPLDTVEDTQICQNELPPAPIPTPLPPLVHTICQNEPAPFAAHPPPFARARTEPVGALLAASSSPTTPSQPVLSKCPSLTGEGTEERGGRGSSPLLYKSRPYRV